MPALSDLLDRARIEDVWLALGGCSLRHGRGIAFWREKADGYNVSIERDKNAWFDHVANEGGGVLDLIVTILGCRRGEAVTWLSQFYSMELDKKNIPAAERLAFVRERHDTEEWRTNTLDTLRISRNGYLAGYHRARRHTCANAGSACCELAMAVEQVYGERVEQLDAYIDSIQNAPWPELFKARWK